MTRRMMSKTIWIENEQLAALNALSAKTRVPKAVFVREAVELVLDKHKAILEQQDADSTDLADPD